MVPRPCDFLKFSKITIRAKSNVFEKSWKIRFLSNLNKWRLVRRAMNRTILPGRLYVKIRHSLLMRGDIEGFFGQGQTLTGSSTAKKAPIGTLFFFNEVSYPRATRIRNKKYNPSMFLRNQGPPYLTWGFSKKSTAKTKTATGLRFVA